MGGTWNGTLGLETSDTLGLVKVRQKSNCLRTISKIWHLLHRRMTSLGAPSSEGKRARLAKTSSLDLVDVS